MENNIKKNPVGFLFENGALTFVKSSYNSLYRYINFSNIQVKQVKNNQNQYLIDLSEINSLKKQNNYIGIVFFSLMGFVFFYLTIINYKAYLKSLTR